MQKKTVLHAMLEWSTTQDSWVLDALGRIFRGEQIADSDISRYVTSLLSDQPPERFEPLLEHELPTSQSGNENVSLVSIGNLEGVNRMAPGYILEFGPGLSIVYGANGAGKSGFCRVLKRACRSRGTNPEILGDMLSGTSEEQKATITFKTERGVTKTTWVSGTTRINSLGNAFVFDSATAQHYVSASDKASFTPFGLDILPKLVPVMDQVQASLGEQKKTLLAEIDTLSRAFIIEPNTESAKYISSLNAKSDKAKLDRLTSLSEQNLARKRLLVDLLNKDPSIEAEKSKNAKERIQTFLKKINQVLEQLELSNIKTVEDLRTFIVQARDAANSFREHQYQSAVLPGTGNADSWRPLWDAASVFSSKCAYPSMKFPFVEGDPLCVLCQNPLREPGKARLLDFRTSVEASEEKHLSSLEMKLQKMDLALKSLPSINTESKSIVADIEVGIRSELDKIAILALGIDQQIALLRLSLQSSDPLVITIPDLAVLKKLSDYVEDLSSLEATQRKAADPEGRKTLQLELTELLTREKLAAYRDIILRVIEDYRKVARIDALIRETKTANVTKFYGQLASDWITEPFRQNLNTELDRLGLITIRPILKAENSKGQVYYTLSLREGLSQKLVNIASEGEQRCIALAGFLAELGQASHQSAILFDDPVSSLDHRYQDKVAERLSIESRSRQVVVFTHDIAFVHQLLRWQDSHGGKAVTRTIEWDGELRRPGAVRDSLPWNVEGTDAQIHALKNKQRVLRSTWVPQPTDKNTCELESCYSLLRSAIERSVDQVLLNGIVERFSNETHIGRIDKLAELPRELLLQLKALDKRCHELINAHAKAIVTTQGEPSPDILLADIEELEAICNTIKENRKRYA